MHNHTKLSIGVLLFLLLPSLVSAEDRFYHLEVGLQVGASYYMGELAPYAFMSTAEAYGLQARFKIDRRWAVQLKGMRQRVVNNVKEGNEWGIKPRAYQVPMWHFDIVGEYNFFPLGWNAYDIHVKNITPYISVGVGMTVQNRYPTVEVGKYPALDLKHENRMEYAMYIPVGVGLKWKVAERWQLQLLWQHELYVLNGDGLEGVVTKEGSGHKGDVWLNNSHDINGINILNNDVTSTLTAGVVFEFGHKKKKCLFCIFDN
jgi:hypothetical protein